MVIQSYTVTVKEFEIRFHCTAEAGETFDMVIPIGPDLPGYYPNATKCSKDLAGLYLWAFSVEFNEGFKEAVEADIYNAIKNYFTEA